MAEIKKYESSVIKRACYMVNTYNMSTDELLKSFYFTGEFSFDKWCETDGDDSSWILSSFYRLCKLFYEIKAEKDSRAESDRENFIIPACDVINECIDAENDLLDRNLSKELYFDTTVNTLMQHGYSYDYAQKRATYMLNGTEYTELCNKLISDARSSFESKMKTLLNDIYIDVSKLWSSSTKRYNRATPDDITYTGGKKQRNTDDVLSISNVSATNFSEYQYLMALEKILDKEDVKDEAIQNAVASAKKSYFAPPENEDGLPGANWDILETLIDENPGLEDDIISVIHYCAYNEKPDIKESWLFKYIPRVSIGLEGAEKEDELLFDRTVNECLSPYLRAAVAFAKCLRMYVLSVLHNALCNNTQVPPTVAEVMDSLNIRPYEFDNERGQLFISDLIKLMQDDSFPLDTTGMEAI